MTQSNPTESVDTHSAAHAVNETDVQSVASLANLELTADELPAMRRDLNAILGYIAQLNELDTAAVEPMAQVSEILATAEAAETPLRTDSPVPGLERLAVLRSAPDTDGAFFRVPKVIER